MPARSKAQRQLMAIAEHHPEEVSSKNAGVLKMSQSQLHDFAATKEKKLPQRVKKTQPSPKYPDVHMYGRRRPS